MADELAESGEAVARLLTQNALFREIARRIAKATPRLAVLCGRGSSGHAGVYLRYLFETRCALLGSAAAPSVFTAYGKRPDMGGTLFVVISQSGRSPDLLTATEAARMQGALTLALVNDVDSPVAQAAELVLPVLAGPERSVAATKSVIAAMAAGAMLVAHLEPDDALRTAIGRWPERLNAALSCDWTEWSASLAHAPAAFVAGRGYGFGPAREIALKLAETLRMPALGYSAAELRHGPRAAINPRTPVLLLRQDDRSADMVDDLADELVAGGETVFVAGGSRSRLPWIGDDHPLCDPVTLLMPAYRAIERAARLKGFDPDRPPHLEKVTRTF